MSKQSQSIVICRSHHDKKKTPLIATMVFPGAEYWCPYCGQKYGMFDDVQTEPISKEMKQLLQKYIKETADFLSAFHLVRGGQKKINGKTVTIDDFPKTEQEDLKKIVQEFKYEGK